jgi:hypothetical protein
MKAPMIKKTKFNGTAKEAVAITSKRSDANLERKLTKSGPMGTV